MIYDISKATAPAMPYLGKGTECIKLLLSQTSKDMREPLVPIFFIAMQQFFHRDATIFLSRWKFSCIEDKSFRPSRIKKWRFRRGRDRPFGVTEKISAERGDNVCIIRQSLPYTDRINVRAWRFCLTESWNPLVWNRK